MKHDVLVLYKDVDEKDISWYIYDKVSDQPWISVPTCHKNVKMYSGWHNWHIEEHRQSSCRFDRNSLFIVCQLDDLFINGSSTELILQQSNNDRKSILKLCFFVNFIHTSLMTHYPADKILPCHKRLTLVTRRSFAIVWAIRGIQVTARAKIRGFSAALQTTWDTWKKNICCNWRTHLSMRMMFVNCYVVWQPSDAWYLYNC